MSWACSACTLVNSADGKVCAACGAEMEAESAADNGAGGQHACAACTFANPIAATKCEMCRTPLKARSGVPLARKEGALAGAPEPLEFSTPSFKRRQIDVLAFLAASDLAAAQSGGQPGVPCSSEGPPRKRTIDVTPSSRTHHAQEDSDSEWSSSDEASEFINDEDEDEIDSDSDSEMVSAATDQTTDDAPPSWKEEEEVDEIEEFVIDKKGPEVYAQASSATNSAPAPSFAPAPISAFSAGLVEIEPTWPLISPHFWSVKQLESMRACAVNFRAFSLEGEETSKIRKVAPPSGAEVDKRRRAREAREERLSNWTPRVTTASSKRAANGSSKRGLQKARAKGQRRKSSAAKSESSKSRSKASSAIKTEP